MSRRARMGAICLWLGSVGPAAAYEPLGSAQSADDANSFDGVPEGLGLGVSLGFPSGVSLAWRRAERSLWQLNVSWSVGD